MPGVEDPSDSLAMCWLLGILVHPKKGSSLPPLVGRTAEACMYRASCFKDSGRSLRGPVSQSFWSAYLL